MEHVTTVEAENLDPRFAELVRQSGRTAGQATFVLLRAAKSRDPSIASVKRHECRHDEGQGDCTAAPSVEG